MYVGAQKIQLIDLYNVNKENIEETKIWANISVNSLQSMIETILGDYKQRTIVINEIVNLAISNKVSDINMDFSGIKNKETIKRFIIEIAPKLREVGITTSIVLNENINKQDFLKIVDYIVTE